MNVRRLKLTNFRGFTDAEFIFGKGMNLLVGINGVGKSTVLDALRVTLSSSLNLLLKNEPALKFRTEDIRLKQRKANPSLGVKLEGEIDNRPFVHTIVKHAKKFVPDPKRKGEVRDQVIETPDQDLMNFDFKSGFGETTPAAVFFSPHRSIISLRQGDKSAFSKKSLEPREFQLQDSANWLLVRKTLSKENDNFTLLIEAVDKTVEKFLGNCRNLRTVKKNSKTTLLIDKEGKTLDVRQLSDGERGVLFLILDLTIRLSRANPKLENPAHDAKAVVLIDELDLHLHTKWQREIVDRLEQTFPNCQFIATTHSPQIVGEVAPQKIQLIQSTGANPENPPQSLGMDTNFILSRLMETDERDQETQKALNEIADLIEADEYEKAQEKVDKIRTELGDFLELVKLQTRIDRLSLLKD